MNSRYVCTFYTATISSLSALRWILHTSVSISYSSDASFLAAIKESLHRSGGWPSFNFITTSTLYLHGQLSLCLCCNHKFKLSHYVELFKLNINTGNSLLSVIHLAWADTISARLADDGNQRARISGSWKSLLQCCQCLFSRGKSDVQVPRQSVRTRQA